MRGRPRYLRITLAKTCTGCGRFLQAADFGNHATTNDGLKTDCRECRSAYERRRRVEHGERLRAYDKSRNGTEHRRAAARRHRANADPTVRAARVRTYHLRTKFGLTEADVAGMLDAQRGLCAICAEPFGTGKRVMCIDHCHDKGVTRALLCRDCNTKLGVVEGWYAEYRAVVDSYVDQPWSHEGQEPCHWSASDRGYIDGDGNECP